MEKLRISMTSLGPSVSRLNVFFIKNLHLVGLIFCILFAVQFFSLNDFSRLGLFVDGDSRGYIYPAFRALEGEGLALIYSRPFVYPLILAAVGYFTGGIENIIYVHFFIFFSTCYLIYLTCMNLAKFMQVSFGGKIYYYFNFVFSLLFCYLFYISGYQIYMVSTVRPEIFTSFFSVLLIYLITKQLNSNYLWVNVFSALSVALFGSILMFATQKWSLFSIVAFSISQSLLYLNFNNFKKYFIFFALSGMIYASLFFTNFILVNKYDPDYSKVFGPTVLACSNLDIIASNIQQKKYAEFDGRLLGDMVQLYNQSASASGYDRLGFNIDICLYNQPDNILTVFAKNGIVSYDEIRDVANKMAFDAIKNNIDLFFYRILSQIFVPLNDIFVKGYYNIDGSYKIQTVNNSNTLLDLSNGEYHSKFINNEIVSSKIEYHIPKSFFFVDFIKTNYILIFAILNSIIILNFFISRNAKPIAVYALAFLLYGASVLPVAMTHSFDIERYIINTQQVIFIVLFSLIVLTKLALTDLLRRIMHSVGASKKLSS